MFLLSQEEFSSSILFRHLRQHSQQQLSLISPHRREHLPCPGRMGSWSLPVPSLGSAPHGTARRCLTHGTASTKQLRCRALQPQQQSNIQNDSLDTCSSVGTWQKAQYLCLSALYELVSSSKSLPFISIRVFSTLYTSATMVLKQKEHSHQIYSVTKLTSENKYLISFLDSELLIQDTTVRSGSF